MKKLLIILATALTALTSCDNYNNKEAYYDLTNVQDKRDYILNVVLHSSYNVGDTVTLYGYTYVITAKVVCNICGMSVNNNKKLRNK